MRIVVGLAVCQGYAQCCFLAPDVFELAGQEALMYVPEPGDEQREAVLRSAATCPVQAIELDLRPDPADGGAARRASSALAHRATTRGSSSSEPHSRVSGSEIASACRHIDLPVTLVERGAAPLIGPLGAPLGSIAAEIQRDHGVDLRCGVTVKSLGGDGEGNVCAVALSDGSRVEVDVVVVALGAIRNVEWLAGSGLAVGPMGVATDTGCRAFDANGLVTDDVFAAGDVARTPHPAYGYQFLSLEHWENAVNQSRVAGHNMVCRPSERHPHLSIPVFWSVQFDHNIKAVGVTSFADQFQFTQGSAKRREFAAAYGHQGRLVAAVTFDQAKSLDFYSAQIEAAASFPLPLQAEDGPASDGPQDIEFPHPSTLDHWPTVVVSGHDPDELRATLVPAART